MSGNSRLIELERPPTTESAVLVRLALPNDSESEIEESLEEMRQLAWTAGANVVCQFVQHRPAPCPATLIGQGKVEEIKVALQELEAEVVIFDSDLTPTQGSKLEKLLEIKVVDRTQLILDIFAQRARTNEGKIQVELAQLRYILPRLAGRGSIMRQQGGIGVRGPGEQKLEVDRRVIRKRIEHLSAGLDSIQKNRRVQRKRRTEGNLGSVALVGYTNAGKSSLLNALVDAGVFVENKLFATLDPCSRACMLPSRRSVVFSDTVGFIKKLPHSLVAAFRATLEEVTEADLLLLVADAAHPAVHEHVNAVYSVLDEIHAGGKLVLTVFNKTDIADAQRVKRLKHEMQPSVAVSAKTGEGLTQLLEEVDRLLSNARRRVRLRIPQQEAGVVSRIHDAGRVLKQEYEANTIVLEAEVEPPLLGQLGRFIIAEDDESSDKTQS